MPAPQAASISADERPSWKAWSQSAASALDPRRVSPSVGPFVSHCSACYFTACVSLGHKPLWFAKLDVLGACLSGAGLKGGGAQRGVQTLCSSGRNSRFGFGLDCESLCQGWGFGEIVARPLPPASVCFLFARFEVVTQPAFRFYFSGNCSIGSWRLGVSVQGGEFEIVLHLHLKPAPPFVF